MPSEADRPFTAAMRDIYDRAVRELNYRPTYFLRMLGEMGGVRTAKALLEGANVSDGFVRLYEARRLDLSVEALVLRPEWRGLFTPDELNRAERRLRDVGFQVPAESSPPVEPGVTSAASEGDRPDDESFADETLPDLPAGDGPLRAVALVTLRPEQSAFRDAVRDRYGEGCQISGCPVMAVVQACHLHRVADGGDYRPENGILLRVDLHVLFDANLVAIHPDTLRVHVHPQLTSTDYADYAGLTLRVGDERPSVIALRRRWSEFTSAGGL